MYMSSIMFHLESDHHANKLNNKTVSKKKKKELNSQFSSAHCTRSYLNAWLCVVNGLFQNKKERQQREKEMGGGGVKYTLKTD